MTLRGDLCADRTPQGGARASAPPNPTFGCYVALGDSYSSGEGAESHAAGTATASNICHRSKNAYPEIVARTLGVEPFRAKPGEKSEFAACSGAVLLDLYNLNHHGNTGEPPQRDHLIVRGKSRTRLVTMSFGGNDIGFSRVVTDCVKTGFWRRVRATLGPDNFVDLLALLPANVQDMAGDPIARSCELRQEPLIKGKLNSVRTKLVAAYRQVADLAPRARILVVGYPNFFPTTVLAEPCAGVITPEDTLWASRQIDRFNGLIQGAVRAAGRPRVLYVPPSPAWRNHTICDEDTWFILPKTLRNLRAGLAEIVPNAPLPGPVLAAVARLVRDLAQDLSNPAAFFHPTAAGQAVLAQEVLAHAS